MTTKSKFLAVYQPCEPIRIVAVFADERRKPVDIVVLAVEVAEVRDPEGAQDSVCTSHELIVWDCANHRPTPFAEIVSHQAEDCVFVSGPSSAPAAWWAGEIKKAQAKLKAAAKAAKHATPTEKPTET